MRVALFSDTFPPQINGVANSVEGIARALAARGDAVLVFTAASRAQAKQMRARANGAYEVALGASLPALVYPGLRVAWPFGAPAAVRAFKPDVIHVHTPFGIGMRGAAAARALKVPLVGTHHTFFDHYLRYVMLDFDAARNLTWRATAAFYNKGKTLSPTRSLKAALESNGLRQPAEVIPNAIDTKRFSPAEPGERAAPTAIYVGRLAYEKSIDDALRAFSAARVRVPAARLLVVGDGPERERLEALAQELGLDESVEFTGVLLGDELVEALRGARVFLTASRSENMPLSILEAMAVGLPVVGVRSLGLEEIVTHGESGLLAEPGDIDALSGHLAELLADESRQAEVSRAALRASGQYSWEAVIERLREAYRG